MRGDQADVFARIKNLLPNWFGQDAAPTPILDGLLQAPAAVLSFVYSLYQYARQQTRIATASDGWLDLIAQDFYGDTLPRQSGESDSAYRARIQANLFPPSNTIAAISASLTQITGMEPRIVEPWRPALTGVWDGAAGQGMAFWDVDNAATPFRWTDGQRGALYIDVVVEPLATLNGYEMPAWDVAPGGWDTYSSSFIDLGASSVFARSQLIVAVRKLKAAGVQAFIKFGGRPGTGGPANWDAGGFWDGSTPPRWDF